jgi:thioesterase domain-containing protein
VASQLIAAGQTVGLLLLLDAVNPVHFARIGAAELAVSKVKFHLAQIVDLAGWRRWRYAIARGQGALHRILHQWSPACLPPALDEKLERAALDYVPPPYPGDVALFQPIEHPALLDYRPGWAEVVRGEFVAHEVPGEHRTVLDLPHVRDLAACMRASLDRAQGIARPGAAAAE